MTNDEIEQENEALFKRLEKADDQSCAIMATSRIDNLLYNAIKEKLLPPKRENSEDPLLDRALQTFSSRIEAAYRLGLISSQHANSLNKLRIIRNEFSHRLEHLTFDSQRQRGRVLEFSKPWNRGKTSVIYNVSPGQSYSLERHHFIMTCYLFITYFTPLIHGVSRVKQIEHVRLHSMKLNKELTEIT